MPREPTVNVSKSEQTGLTAASAYEMSSPHGFIGSARSCWKRHTRGLESPRTPCKFMSMNAGTEGRPVSQPIVGEMSGRMMYASLTNGSGTSRPKVCGSWSRMSQICGTAMSSWCAASRRILVSVARASSRAITFL